ncbi:MAG: polysaccharide biosynthesis C-terminal domain-containing protein [Oscillospiraceae bacterium]|nr:polysaccharide biosynthesis C-terminal domain-containing protein [Oscillospiraceae bacterium]
MRKRTFLFNALCLTASAFVMRLINIGYRIYLTDKIGAEGMGLYQLIYAVFVFAITVSTSGISLSVTRIVTAVLSGGQRKTLRSCVRKCVLFSLSLSLLAAAALICCAGWIGNVIVGDDRVVRSLQVLALGLPFMAACSCLKGYFLAVRGVLKSAMGELLEQFVTISVTVALFVVLSPADVERCCCAIMIGSTVGEMASCLFTYGLYRAHLRKLIGKSHAKSTGVLRQICHIVIPITISSTLRSGLSVIENLLIPIGFRKNGASAASALAEYGIIDGMVMPVLLFPFTFVQSFASLLVPEMTEALTLRHKNHIRYVSGRAIGATLLFSIFTAVFCICFSREIGLLLYDSAESARLMQILAPLIPLLYLDNVVDYLLKGLDQQLPSLRYNFIDTAIRVVLVYFLLPIAGTKGYLCILFFSTIFNAALSLHRLLKTADLQIAVFRRVVLPSFCALLAVILPTLLLRSVPTLGSSLWAMPLCVLLLSVPCYILLLRCVGSVRQEDVLWLRSLFSTTKKTAPQSCPIQKGS